ncbi:MAG: ComEC family competence protein [Patescibacteria group bacterium]|nr:ComEC family competence protein [Patescibacteria group bacterium]
MSAAQVVFVAALGFVAGVVLNAFIDMSQPVMLALLILGIFLVTLFWKKPKVFVAGIVLLSALFGIWRYGIADISRNNDIPYLGEEIYWEVEVVDEDVGAEYTELVVQAEKMNGRILLRTPKYPEYYYKDVLLVRGVLEQPPVFDGFDYRAFLSAKDIYAIVFHPQIELVERGQGSFVSGIKGRLGEVINKYLPPPHSEILAAMILGDKGRMSDSLKEKLNITGVRHITAVSGMHVAILSGIVLSLLLGLGLWRAQATVLSIIFIVLFVILTGFQPSAIRAGLMGGLVLFSQNMGRTNVGVRMLVFVGGAMLLFNPLFIKDVGFQLSFLAVLGITLFLPLARELLRFVPEAFQLRDVLGMTVTAQIFALPLLTWYFGGFSVISFITNLLVVPLVPFILGLGFLFMIMGAVWGGFGYLLFLPVFFLLDYVVRIIEFFSSIPGAFLSSSMFLWVVLILVYILLGYAIWRWHRKYASPF